MCWRNLVTPQLPKMEDLMKRPWMLFALTLYASTPSMAQDTCTQAALAYYCTAVTTALGQAADGDLGNALLAQSNEYVQASKKFGFSSLKQRYYQSGVTDAAEAKDPGVMDKLIKTCVSKDTESMNAFMKSAERTCRQTARNSDTTSAASSEVAKERSSP
jgi:hypothetical protein